MPIARTVARALGEFAARLLIGLAEQAEQRRIEQRRREAEAAHREAQKRAGVAE